MDLKENYAKLYAFGVPSSKNLLPQWSLRVMPIYLGKIGVTGGSFLDFGCGPGHVTNLLTNMGMKGVGFDHDEFMIKYAQKLYPENQFVLCEGDNFHHLPKSDLAFMLCDVINAMPMDVALKAIKGVPVSPDGVMLFDITTRAGFDRWRDVTTWEREDIFIHEQGVVLEDTATLAISGFASFLNDGKFERFHTTVKNYIHDPEEVRKAVESRFSTVRYFDHLGNEGWNPEAVKIVVVATSKGGSIS